MAYACRLTRMCESEVPCSQNYWLNIKYPLSIYFLHKNRTHDTVLPPHVDIQHISSLSPTLQHVMYVDSSLGPGWSPAARPVLCQDLPVHSTIVLPPLHGVFLIPLSPIILSAGFLSFPKLPWNDAPPPYPRPPWVYWRGRDMPNNLFKKCFG